MLQLRNETPFVPGLFLFPDEQGIDTAYVVVKATFSLADKGVAVAGKQVPVIPGDEYWGEPGNSSLRYAGEAHLLKPATDVVLVGTAYAPGGRPAPHFGVSLSVGRLAKRVNVFGDRVWKVSAFGAAPSSPIPTAQVPLRFERAFGGTHPTGPGTLVAEARNPVGVGFQGKRAVSEMHGTPLPNLEDPRSPVTRPSDRRAPAGVGFVASSWQPRVADAGTYDEAWRKRRAPYLPQDFNPRFFQAAPADQVYPGHLQGGEPVELVNVSPRGTQRFHVPRVQLDATVRIAGKEEKLALRIETLLLEPDLERFCLLWRAAAPCDKKALKVEEVRLKLSSLQGVAG